ncbi:putative golgin subfamily A member 6-like protein 3 [Parasteatoda tepidariorum]|uniref:putative golgin subfamily A member 6-like protein 3 n=1 Tax=Parasteatoda tepidariorum TaxID=114398 RepID=UPI0039BD91FF
MKRQREYEERQRDCEERENIRKHELELARLQATSHRTATVNDRRQKEEYEENLRQRENEERQREYEERQREYEERQRDYEERENIIKPELELARLQAISHRTEEFLKAWKQISSCAASVDAKEQITNIKAFLKTETEGEERINLVMSGFGLGSDEKRQPFKKKARDLSTRRFPTAANLLTTDVKDLKKGCVFCSG